MREEQNLNHYLLNISKDGNGNGNTTNVFQQLQSVTEQRVDEIDYQQQIERWNRYQELLDEIGKRCNRRGAVVGVRLARNVRHNFRVLTDTSSAALTMISMIALMSFWGAFSINNIYGIAASLAALGFVG